MEGETTLTFHVDWIKDNSSISPTNHLNFCQVTAVINRAWACAAVYYRGADKSVAQPGRKQANISVRMA